MWRFVLVAGRRWRAGALGHRIAVVPAGTRGIRHSPQPLLFGDPGKQPGVAIACPDEQNRVIACEGHFQGPKERGWSIREMARRARVSHTAIASALNRKGRPSAELCVAIADTLGVPAIEVVQRAGILPPDPPETAAWRRLNEMWAQLSDEDQKRILEIVETWVQKRAQPRMDDE
jgi:transcriptional regulator with XRE-family HTH domain